MITEKIIKDKFIIDTLKSNFDEMRGIQLQILGHADDRIQRKFDIPAITDKVSSRTPSITGSDGRIMLSLRITRQLRFLDMKKFGNLKIYNKQVWGYIYNDILPELKYGFSEEVREGIRRELEQTLKPLNTNNYAD
jgi:hypothetical protein